MPRLARTCIMKVFARDLDSVPADSIEFLHRRACNSQLWSLSYTGSKQRH